MSSETQASALPQQLPPPKFSRYRSVRQAKGINSTSSPTPPFQIPAASHDTAFSRSPSRYHKKLKSTDSATETAVDQRTRPAAPLHSHSASLAALTGEPYPVATQRDTPDTSFKTSSSDGVMPPVSIRTKPITRPDQHPSPSCPIAFANADQSPQSHNAPDTTTSRIALSENEANEGARQNARADEERIRRIKANQNAVREFERSNRMASADKLRPENLPNNERHARAAEALKSHGRGPTLATKPKRPTQGPAREQAKMVSPNNIRDPASYTSEVGELRKGQGQDADTGEAPPPPVRNLSSHQKLTHPAQRRPPAPSQQLNMPPEPQPIGSSLASSKPIVPDPVTSDIPRSAVNAGERRVVVKYNESVISLPITPTTTPGELLNSALTSVSSPFDPQKSVLLESFTQLGLERPLRRYEHVRDVMNSWDYDTQNHLIVMTASANTLSSGDLDPGVLSKQPGGTSLYMHHSQRPGKWDKRWVSLREDGQISISKREDGSESSHICHLSDFDIYQPTQRQMKRLRPPRKICFAIKSQQKSAMFLNGANFVHFFATSDGPPTETWYSAVRTWRSWYLVNVLGEGQEQEDSQLLSQRSSAGPWKTASAASGTSEQNLLLSPKRGPQSNPGFAQAGSLPKAGPRPPPSRVMQKRDLCEVPSRGRSAPPSSFPNFHIQHPDPNVPSSVSRRAPSLVRSGAASMRSKVEAPSSLRRSTSLSRAESTRQRPRPLVDLNPQFQEQPQHLKKGRGVASIPGKPLVELATDVEALPGTIIAPAARAWQRPQDNVIDANAGDGTIVQISGGSAEPSSAAMAFTGTGLLGRSKSKRAQGGIGHGYGIKTGDRNQVGKPLLDLRIESQFADGSLLRQVETSQGEDERGLIVDRAKRMEREVSVGEGV